MQNVLAETVFSHVESPKKAAGRALGSIIEIIGFYLIKAWGHEYNTAIEKPLPEYANKDILHNVEFTFHRSKLIKTLKTPTGTAITSTKLFNISALPGKFRKSETPRHLLKDGVIKNACTFAHSDLSFCNAYFALDKKNILLYELQNAPFAMFECKRVGVEEGMKKGPQAIEKAKQGAYVARAVSSVQRIRMKNGGIAGAVESNGGIKVIGDYDKFVEKAIFEHDLEALARFVLTVGIVSNHGNWFTSNNQNKEMRVLAQSYDWLLFLTDEGLTKFLRDIFITKSNECEAVKTAFAKSYKRGKSGNCFTKTRMDIDADRALTRYFFQKDIRMQSWFNVIAPKGKTIDELKSMLNELAELEV